MTTHNADLALVDADYPRCAFWKLTVWLRIEEKRRTAAAQPFLHADEGGASFSSRARGKAMREGFVCAGEGNVAPEIVMASWYAKLIFLSAGSHDMPSCYFCQVYLPNCWRQIFLVLSKLYGCQVIFVKLLEMLLPCELMRYRRKKKKTWKLENQRDRKPWSCSMHQRLVRHLSISVSRTLAWQTRTKKKLCREENSCSPFFWEK